MPADALFDPLLAPAALRRATGSQAWIRAMLDVEAALADAEAAAGVIPPEAAAVIVARCASAAAEADPEALGVAGAAHGNPAVPLVAWLRQQVPDPAARRWVHHGATSQDVLDTAAVLVTRQAASLVFDDLAALATACAHLADVHRDTLMIGRTLLRDALPITFGLKVATWLDGLCQAAVLLDTATATLAAQLGGASGTLASLGTAGPDVAQRFATQLGLPAPLLPWHSARQRMGALAAALAVVAGSAAKITGDVALLMQDTVAEASEPGGGSSAMPHKQNPAHAVGAAVAARRAAALVPVVLASLTGEHERSLSGWQGEWPALSDLLVCAGGAVHHARASVEQLTVDSRSMARHVFEHDAMLAEAATVVLGDMLGDKARDVVTAAARRASEHTEGQGERGSTQPRGFVDELLADSHVGAVVDAAELRRRLDPAQNLGATGTWIDRALARYQATSVLVDRTPVADSPLAAAGGLDNVAIKGRSAAKLASVAPAEQDRRR